MFNVGLLFLMISISKINDSSFPRHFLNEDPKVCVKIHPFQVMFLKEILGTVTECLCSPTR